MTKQRCCDTILLVNEDDQHHSCTETATTSRIPASSMEIPKSLMSSHDDYDMPSSTLSLSTFSSSASECYSVVSSIADGEGDDDGNDEILAITKRVRFSQEAPTFHDYPRPKKYLSDMNTSESEASKAYEQTKQGAIAWRRHAMPLLQDFYNLPVKTRIERMTTFHNHYILAHARGLEKVVCPAFGDASVRKRKEHIYSVLDLQDALRKEGMAPAASRRGARSLAHQAKEQSHDARCLGRVLGLADQQYIRYMLQQEKQQQQQQQQPEKVDRDTKLDCSNTKKIPGKSKSLTRVIRRLGESVTKRTAPARNDSTRSMPMPTAA